MPEIRRYQVTQVRAITVETPVGFEGQFSEEDAVAAALHADAGEWRTLNLDIRRADVMYVDPHPSAARPPLGTAIGPPLGTATRPPPLTRTQDLPVTSR